MRTLLLLLTVAAISVCVCDTPAVADDNVDFKKLISDYLTPHMPDSRRAEILKELSDVPPKDMSPQLKKALSEDDQRPHALRLATEYQVEGLYSTAAKHYDSQEQEQVIRYGLTVLDRGAEKFFVKRWTEAKADSDEFKNLQRAFQTHGIDPKLLSDFKKVMDDEKATDERREAAFDVLRYQVGSTLWDRDEFTKAWPDLFKEVRKTGAALKGKGRDMLRRTSWTRSNARQWGYAMKIASPGEAHNQACAPPGLDNGSFTVVAHLLLETEDTEGRVWLNALESDGDLPGYPVMFEGNKWKVRTGTDDIDGGQVPHGRWFQVQWDVENRLSDPVLGDFRVTITVNGTQAKSGSMRGFGVPCRFSFEATEGTILVGLVDYIRD